GSSSIARRAAACPSRCFRWPFRQTASRPWAKASSGDSAIAWPTSRSARSNRSWARSTSARRMWGFTGSPSELQVLDHIVVGPALVRVEGIVPGSGEPLPRRRLHLVRRGEEIAGRQRLRDARLRGLAELALDRHIKEALQVGPGELDGLLGQRL